MAAHTPPHPYQPQQPNDGSACALPTSNTEHTHAPYMGDKEQLDRGSRNGRAYPTPIHASQQNDDSACALPYTY